MQFIVRSEDFMQRVWEWMSGLDDERMQLLKRFMFEVDLTDTEALTEALYGYGSCLTEKNYPERKFFECMVGLVRQLQLSRAAVE